MMDKRPLDILLLKFKIKWWPFKLWVLSSTLSLPSIPVFWAALDYLAILNTIPSHFAILHCTQHKYFSTLERNTYRRQCKAEQNTVSVESEGKLNESHLMLAREGFAQLLFSNDYDVDDDGSDDEDGDDSDHSPQFRQIIQKTTF